MPQLKNQKLPDFSGKLPNFSAEKKLWRKDFKLVAGVDEVGRGAWAGPIVAAAVVFPTGPVAPSSRPMSSRQALAGTRRDSLRSRHPSDILDVGINDSKQLRPRQREKLAEFIKENCLGWGIGETPASVINRLGMARATKMAFRKAIKQLSNKDNKSIKPEFLLIDAFFIPYVRGLRRKRQKAIVDGDQKSISIAAASILAKVYRDKLMKKIAQKYMVYAWGRNKGYGTREHQKALKKHGLTRYHRKEFVKTWKEKRRVTLVQYQKN